MNRRAVLTSLGALGISGLAGCTTDTGQPSPSDNATDETSTTSPSGTRTPTDETPTTSPSGTRTPTDRPEDETDSRLTVPCGSEVGRWHDVDYGGDHSYPAPPSTLEADVVRDVAAEAEEANLYDRFENADGVDSFGVAGYTVDPGAYVADRNADAVLVRVRLGYYTSSGDRIADRVSRATYRITTDEVVRVDDTRRSPSC